MQWRKKEAKKERELEEIHRVGDNNKDLRYKAKKIRTVGRLPCW